MLAHQDAHLRGQGHRDRLACSGCFVMRRMRAKRRTFQLVQHELYNPPFCLLPRPAAPRKKGAAVPRLLLDIFLLYHFPVPSQRPTGQKFDEREIFSPFAAQILTVVPRFQAFFVHFADFTKSPPNPLFSPPAGAAGPAGGFWMFANRRRVCYTIYIEYRRSERNAGAGPDCRRPPITIRRSRHESSQSNARFLYCSCRRSNGAAALLPGQKCPSLYPHLWRRRSKLTKNAPRACRSKAAGPCFCFSTVPAGGRRR